MSSGAFVDLCRTKLSSQDIPPLDFCTLEPSLTDTDKTNVNSPFIESFHDWEKALRLNLARFRKERLKQQGTSIEAPEYPVSAVSAAKTAVGIDSPLDAELFLGEARWNEIENLQGISYFSENVIYAYLLKLLLLERRALFKAEDGFQEYKTLYSAILEAGNIGING
jgi:hypothetical protein